MKQKSFLFTVSSIFFSISFLAIGYGMIMTFTIVYLKDRGTTDFAIGLINASFFLGAILSSIYSQKIISNIGHIRSFVTFAAVMVIAFLLHSFYINDIVWAILRFFTGLSYYSLLIIIESWLNERSPDEQRGKILAVYTIVFYLATALGQLFLNIGDLKHIIFSVGGVLVLLSLIVIAMTKIKEPDLKPFERYTFPKIYSVAPLALVGSFSGGLFVSGFFTMVPLYVLNVFNSKEIVSIFMAITILGGLIAQWPIGMLSDRYGRRKLIALSSVLAMVVSILFVVVDVSNSLLYLLGFLLGSGLFCIYPLSVARANDVIDENKDIVEISRTLLFSYGFGSLVAPVTIGIAYKFFSPNVIFIIFASLGAFLAFYSLFSKKVAHDELSVYVNLPATAGAAVAEIDPRQDEQWVEEHSYYANTDEEVLEKEEESK